MKLLWAFSTWQVHLLHFLLTAAFIVVYQPSFRVYDEHGGYAWLSMAYSAFWGALFALINVKGFLIFHDCLHHSFFAENWKNEACGRMFGMFQCVPFGYYRDLHLRHHAIQGSLDQIDYDTIQFTLDAVKNFPVVLRELYLFIRHPLIFQFVVPPLIWFIVFPLYAVVYLDPFPFIGYFARYYAFIYFANTDECSFWCLFAANMVTGYLGIVVGFVLFHLQHSHNPSYKKTKEKGFERREAAIHGSYTHKVPFWMKPFTLGIEYHTLHHYEMGLPGYELQALYNQVTRPQVDSKHLQYTVYRDGTEKTGKFDARMADIEMVGYRDMWRNMFHVVYDEKAGRYISWSDTVRRIYLGEQHERKQTGNKKLH